MSDNKLSVAFVCLGNICRSPMAEAVFVHQVEKHGLRDKFELIDSFGTGSWHVGERPDYRSARCCKDNGVKVDHRAQQIRPSHFNKFDYILCMDRSNLSNLLDMKPKDSAAKVMLFGEFRKSDKFNKIVEDPYYGGDSGFQTNFEQLVDFSEGFLEKLELI